MTHRLVDAKRLEIDKGAVDVVGLTVIVVIGDGPIPIAEDDHRVAPVRRLVPRRAAAHHPARIDLRPRQLAAARVVGQVERPDGERRERVREERPGYDEVSADDGTGREAQAGR